MAPALGQEAEQVALFSRAPAFFEDGVNVYIFMRPCEKNVDIRKDPYLFKRRWLDALQQAALFSLPPSQERE